MRVLFTRTLPEAVTDAARTGDIEAVVRSSNVPLTADEVRTALQEFDGIVPTLGDPFDAAAFADVTEPRTRVLANFGVGYNHIDVAAARAAGVIVTNTPGAVTDATADIALTLILMSARRAGQGERLVRSGKWDGWHPTQMLGLHVTGKRLGVVGMGRIGQAIARRCHYGFDMEIAYFSRSEKHLEFPATRMDDLAALAAGVDIMVVAVPAGPETHHMIDAGIIGALRPHAHLVNIARGDVVDEAALIEALQAERISGAGLDVYEREPEVPESLRALDNATLLPHLGTAALEVRTAMGLMAVDNLIAVLNGAAPPNPV